jgi:sulfur-oxidizing protein SoxY
MDHPRRTSTRRDVLVAVASGVVAGFLPADANAQDKPIAPAPAPQAWETAMRAITGDAVVIDGRIVMDLPEIAENGNVVPLNVAVTSAMTGNDFVRTLHIFSTGNPHPLIATFRFSADSGRAVMSGRMRLAKTQEVIALAELGDGTFLRGRRTVKVTIGGCGG